MLKTVADILMRRGIPGWLVGGSLRDRALGILAPDVDLVVAGEAASVAKDVARALHSPWFTLSERHGAYRVVGPNGHADVAALRGGGILDDLALRDFTVNAMALPLSPESAAAWAQGAEFVAQHVIDPYGGLGHLQARRLVAVSPHIFRDDPLRLLRAVRFSHVLGLRIEPELETAVRRDAARLADVASERVASELILTLAAGTAGEAVRLWERLDLWGVLFPEAVEEGVAAPQVADRLDGLESVLAGLATLFPECVPLLTIRMHQPVDGTVERPVGLRLAGLTSLLRPETAQRLGRRLRFSNQVISLLVTASRTRTAQEDRLPLPVELERPGRSAVLFLWAAAPWEPEVILLAAAAQRPLAPSAAQAARALLALWAWRATRGLEAPPVEGRTLMRELELGPGPELGRVLREVRLAWEAGEVTDAAQALEVARSQVAGRRSPPGS